MSVRVEGKIVHHTSDRNVPDVVLSLTGDDTGNTPSASDGTYAFTAIAAGTYTITPGKTTDLGGVNATDALGVVRHTAAVDPFTDPHQIAAADVNASGTVNATDAAKIARFTVGLEDLPSGDWLFDPQSRSYEPLDAHRTDQDYVGIRMGDVNASWTADGGGSKPALVAGGVRLRLPDLTAWTGEGLDVPVRVSGAASVGALTLFLSYPSEVLRFEGIAGIPSEFDPIVNTEDDILRIAWVDMSGVTPLQTSEPLLRLQFTVLGSEGHTGAIDILAGTELADESGAVIPADVRGSTIRIVRKPTEYALSQNHPNPFNPDTQIAYQLPKAGDVSLVIYNSLGQLVRELVREHQQAGYYRVGWDGRDAYGRRVSSGIYIYRMLSGDFSRTHRMLLLK